MRSYNQPPFEAHFLRKNGSQSAAEKLKSNTSSGLFELIWIKEGKGSLRVDLNQVQIDNDVLYCMCPGQIHYFSPCGEITGYRVAFSPDFMVPDFGRANKGLTYGICESENVLPTVQLNGEFRSEIELVLQQMIWEYKNNCHLKFKILEGLLKIFVAHFSRNFASSPIQPAIKADQPILDRFLDLVEKKFCSYKMVNQYADELAITPNYLSEVVKRSSGFSASYFIHHRVILEAKRIAVNSDYTMKEIAFRIGFEDPFQFSKFFKLKTGTTFSEFRKKHQLDNCMF